MKQLKMTSRKTPLQTRSRERVELIIASAEKLLKETDLSKVTTSRIAEEASIPVGSIYQYFKDRDEILLALGEKVLAEEDQKIAETLSAHQPGTHWRDVVRDVLEFFVEQVSNDDIHYKLDAALPNSPEWQKANMVSEMRMIEVFAAFPLFEERGFSHAEAISVSRVIVVIVTAIVTRSKGPYAQGDLGDILVQTEKMVIAYLATVFGE